VTEHPSARPAVVRGGADDDGPGGDVQHA
jgi:hypothetical protein